MKTKQYYFYKKLVLFLVLLVIFSISVITLLYLKNYQPNQKSDLNIPLDWPTYSYKNMSFRHPRDWIVVFDSEISGQPNGFDLHVQKSGDGGYEPDGLYISSYNHGDDINYILSLDRKFSQTGNRRIQFNINGVPIYSGCAAHTRPQTTIEICNKILSTFKLTR